MNQNTTIQYNIKEVFNNNWLFFIIATQPILDIIAFFTFNNTVTIISFITRSIYLFIIVTYSFISVSKKRLYLLIMLPWILLSIIHLANSIRTSGGNILDDTRYLIIVMQLPISAIALTLYAREHIDATLQLEKGILTAVITIFISVILSLLTNTGKSTYETFGLNGWFTSPNAQSMILSTISPIALYISSKKNDIIYLFISLMIFILLFFNGTRACYYSLVAMLFVMLYILLTTSKENKNKCAIIITVIFIALTLGLYKYSASLTRANDVHKNAKAFKFKISKNLTRDEAHKIIRKSPLTKQMVDDLGFEWTYNNMKEHISAYNLTDNRLVKRMYAKYIYEHSDYLTKIVGFNHGEIEKYGMDLENDLTALYYYYGYLGSIVFIAYIIICAIQAIKLIIRKPKIIFGSKFVILCFTVVLAIGGAEYSGALLRKPNANIYLSAIIALLMNYIYVNSTGENNYEK